MEESKEIILKIKETREKVNQSMLMRYGLTLNDLEIADTPGYWRDKIAKIHKGHPLHGCVGCQGPFKATYTYFDNNRDWKTGRFLSPTRSWKLLKQ